MDITPALETALREAADDYAEAVGVAINDEYGLSPLELTSLKDTIKNDWDLRPRPWLVTADELPALIAAIKSVIGEIAADDVSLDVTNHLNELLARFESLTGTRPTPAELA